MAAASRRTGGVAILVLVLLLHKALLFEFLLQLLERDGVQVLLEKFEDRGLQVLEGAREMGGSRAAVDVMAVTKGQSLGRGKIKAARLKSRCHKARRASAHLRSRRRQLRLVRLFLALFRRWHGRRWCFGGLPISSGTACYSNVREGAKGRNKKAEESERQPYKSRREAGPWCLFFACKCGLPST